jgi:uncharacterized membrane protein YidH (DUF202 family)
MKHEVVEKLATLITAAFGLVAALAWNDTIKAIFQNYYGEASSVPAMLTYAIIVTIVAVIATIKIARLEEKISKKEEKQTTLPSS